MTETALSPARTVRLPDGTCILEFSELRSTQDAAVEIARRGPTKVAAVRTEFQTAGRGRTGGEWISPAGACLLSSYILQCDDMPPADAPKLALVAAGAGGPAIEPITGLRLG